MPKFVKTLMAVLLLPVCFAAGLYAGPHAAALYYKVFPKPEYKTGDFSAMYAQAGAKVVLYSTTTCPYCAKVRQLFAERGVSYKDYQIDKSPEARDEFKRRGGQFVPLLYIGDREISGFREQAIREAIEEVGKKS